MKKLIIIIVACYIVGISVDAYMGFIMGRKIEQDKIDLPEEIKALSTDQTNPDTMLSYQYDGKIYMRFKH